MVIRGNRCDMTLIGEVPSGVRVVREGISIHVFVCLFFVFCFFLFFVFGFAFCFVLLFFILRIEKRRSGIWRREVNYDISKVN